jgi:hypothetical protein
VDLQGIIFEDANQNGTQDENEKSVPGVTVRVDHHTATTNTQGQFNLTGLPKGKQAIFVDPATLPTGTQVLTANPQEHFLESAREELSIPVRRQITLQGILFASPLLAKGLDDIEIRIDNTETVVSQYGGRFTQVLSPGKHQIRLNPLTIPEGYRLRGPLMQAIDSQDNLRLHFVFEPMITLTLKCVDPQQHGLKGISVTASALLDPQKTHQGITNSTGQVIFEGILPGEVHVTISGQNFTLSLEDTPGVQTHTLILKRQND